MPRRGDNSAPSAAAIIVKPRPSSCPEARGAIAAAAVAAMAARSKESR